MTYFISPPSSCLLTNKVQNILPGLTKNVTNTRGKFFCAFGKSSSQLFLTQPCRYRGNTDESHHFCLSPIHQRESKPEKQLATDSIGRHCAKQAMSRTMLQRIHRCPSNISFMVYCRFSETGESSRAPFNLLFDN